jgi:hypothetical protein
LKVFTAGETIKVVVPQDAVTINGNPQPDSETEVVFPKIPALVPGYNYVLRLRIRIPRWAGSNIYWAGDNSSGQLTFDVHGDRTYEGRQGVFFRWGSLVGLAPRGDFDASSPVYVPDNTKATKWRPSTAGAEQYDEWKEQPSLITSGKDIPYMDQENHSTNGTGYYDTHLLDEAQNTPEMYQGFRGDICQYLGTTDDDLKGYRMPMLIEFGVSYHLEWTNHPDSWIKGGIPTTLNTSLYNDYGTTVLTGSPLNCFYAENTAMDVLFPASGNRNATGVLGGVGGTGRCWIGGASGNAGRYFSFTDYEVCSLFGYIPAFAFPVRCVKN